MFVIFLAVLTEVLLHLSSFLSEISLPFEYSKGVDTLAQSNSDSDEEEILLAAPIPVKTRKVLW